MRVIDIEKQLAGQVPRVSPWSTPGWLVGWRPYTGRGLVGAGGWVSSLVVGSVRWWLGQFAGGWVSSLVVGSIRWWLGRLPRLREGCEGG